VQRVKSTGQLSGTALNKGYKAVQVTHNAAENYHQEGRMV